MIERKKESPKKKNDRKKMTIYQISLDLRAKINFNH